MKFSVLVEGSLEEPVARRLLSATGHKVDRLFVCDGKDDFMERWADFAAGPGARFGIRDLDHDSDCAPTWLASRQLGLGSKVLLRLAVREIEAWLLADRERFTRHFGCSLTEISKKPDTLGEPKEHVVELMKRSSNHEFRLRLVPRRGGGRTVGEGHTTLLGQFAADVWRPREAAKRSDSLRRAIAALDRV